MMTEHTLWLVYLKLYRNMGYIGHKKLLTRNLRFLGNLILATEINFNGLYDQFYKRG